MVNFTHRPLHPRGNTPRYPLDGKPDDSQSRSGRGGKVKKKKIQAPAENRNQVVRPAA